MDHNQDAEEREGLREGDLKRLLVAWAKEVGVYTSATAAAGMGAQVTQAEKDTAMGAVLSLVEHLGYSLHNHSEDDDAARGPPAPVRGGAVSDDSGTDEEKKAARAEDGREAPNGRPQRRARAEARPVPAAPKREDKYGRRLGAGERAENKLPAQQSRAEWEAHRRRAMRARSRRKDAGLEERGNRGQARRVSLGGGAVEDEMRRLRRMMEALEAKRNPLPVREESAGFRNILRPGGAARSIFGLAPDRLSEEDGASEEDERSGRYYLKGWNAAAARRLRADQTAASIFHHMKDNDKKGYTDLFRNALENNDHKMMKKLTQKRLHGRLKDRDEYTAWEFIANIPAEFNSFHEFVTAPASGFAVGRDGSTKDVLLHRDCADMATVLDLIGTEKYGEALEVGVRFLSVRYLMSRYRTEHPGAKDEKAMYNYAVKIRSHRALRGGSPVSAAYL